MKKILLIMTAILLLCPKSYAADDTIALLAKKGFFEKPQSSMINVSPYEEIKRTMGLHLKYANSYNYDGLKSLYSDSYINADGLGKDIYFNLIKKTWVSYPNIKYKMNIRDIEVNDNSAVVQVNEDAIANTEAKSGLVNERGLLESTSNSVYYLEKVGTDWLITSDHILSEETMLRYGSAKYTCVDLAAPAQVSAGSPYTAALKLDAPKDSLVIASVGQEKITYPQVNAEEVFRKMPSDGILERMFKANSNNLNEYAVASFGVTKAEFRRGEEIKIYVTGLGFIMSRVNVVPKNDFIKVVDNAKTE